MDISGLLKDVRESTGSASFRDSKFGMIDHYIDTGSYAMNRIISGSVYGGMPGGRVLLFGGESSTGKTYVTVKIVANALLKHDYEHVFYFDSEGGGLKDMWVGAGCDPSKVEHIPVISTEDAHVKIVGVYNKIMLFKKTNPNARFFCILDSIGALVPNKIYTDAAKGKLVSDMGLAAKLNNTLVKAITMPALISNTGMLITNHVYDDPSDLYPSKIKNMSGGKRLHFLATISMQTTRKLERDEEKETGAFYKGSALNFMTVKNRIVKPFFDCDLKVDFNTGMNPYDGLLDVAVKYGIITQAGAYYKVPSYSDKNLRSDDLTDDVWKSILKEIDTKSQKDMSYSRTELLEVEHLEAQAKKDDEVTTATSEPVVDTALMETIEKKRVKTAKK